MKDKSITFHIFCICYRNKGKEGEALWALNVHLIF